jgi:natural product biosynthesis luciferase-like monooxygenase protein
MRFGIMFFSSQVEDGQPDKYRLLLEAAALADRLGFCAVWTPERHFDRFGGIFPNPVVTSAALSMVTKNIQLRAGSLIAPLHDVIRIAEDWAMVDNLSGGRAAISFGSGWNVNDFVFFPERYEARKKFLYQQIEIIRRLWRGQSIVRQNTFGIPMEIVLRPMPVQPELPFWITSSSSPETFTSAGSIGANLLTHLVGQEIVEMGRKIDLYRQARRNSGFDPAAGIVSLMLHTFVSDMMETSRVQARPPFKEYLRAAVALEKKAAQGGGTISGGHQLAVAEVPEEITEELLDLTCDRYLEDAALIGTPESCSGLIRKLTALGVDEIACLVDFGLPDAAVLNGLKYLDELRKKHA